MTEFTNAKEYLCAVVSSALNKTVCPLPTPDINMNSVVKLAYRNSLQVILYLSFKDRSDQFSKEDFKRLEDSYKAAVMREAAQRNELAYIKKEFNENGIDFMLQKGTLLKSLYPEPEMRFMSDIDILVKNEDIARAENIVLKRGFSREMNNGKDLVLIKKPFLNIELHRSLFVEDDSMYSYFTGAWQRAEKAENHEYKMIDNDMYVYVMAHLAEHFKVGGSCYRPTMDVFLLNKYKNDTLDFEYINKQFDILGISDFAENIKKVGEHWFSDGEISENLELTEKYIILGAPIENADTVVLKMNSKKSKPAIILSYAFPPLKTMKKLYAVLERFPVLLPFCWIARLFKRGKKAKDKLSALSSVNDTGIDKMTEILNKSGLKIENNHR